MNTEVGAGLEPGRYVVTVTVQNARRATTPAAATEHIIVADQE